MNVLLWASLGSLAAILFRFYRHTPKEMISESRWLLARPPLGILMGVLVYLDLDLPEAEPQELSEAELAPYEGRYTAAMSICDVPQEKKGLALDITPLGGFPTPQSPAPPPPPLMHAVFCSQDQLVIVDEPLKDGRADFLREADGKLV